MEVVWEKAEVDVADDAATTTTTAAAAAAAAAARACLGRRREGGVVAVVIMFDPGAYSDKDMILVCSNSLLRLRRGKCRQTEQTQGRKH
jgi:F420-0:gamma-glutamyl ligase